MHGRALPVATAVKLANKDLTVIAAGGDGDGYAIGAGHFLHAVRRNPNMTYIVMDNQTYGLTKGQSSPTSQTRIRDRDEPGRQSGRAAQRAGGRARGRRHVHRARLFIAAEGARRDDQGRRSRHPGFAIVEVMSPCVTFNKINTYKWFKENTYTVGGAESYDPGDRRQAFDVMTGDGKIPLGVLYRESRPTLETLAHLGETPVAHLDLDPHTAALEAIQESYR